MKFIFKDFQSVESYREDWNKLAEIQNNALISYEWFSCCASSFHSNDSLFIVCIVVNHELIAVAPLYKNISDRHLKIIGSKRLYEPSAILYKDDSALTKLIKACAEIGIPILLSRIFHNIYCETKFDLLNMRSFLINRLSASSQFIELEPDFESYEKNLASRKRYDIRRANKKAKEYGYIKYEINEKNITNLDQLLQQAYDIENQSWKCRTASSITHNEDLNRFFSCLFHSLSMSKKCIISFLLIDNKPVATQLAIKQFDRIWILKIGYNENYASCSPGALLMHEMIRYAHNSNLKMFEFLGNEEPWLDSWRPDIRQYNNLLLYPLSYKGLTGLWLDAFNAMFDKLTNVIFK